MAPIRVGLIGLSTTEPTLAGGTWAAVAFLPSFIHSPDYEIVALCNSSADSARRSIAYHGLPETTKAYGNAEELAKDTDVDLVVVSVKVPEHKKLFQPALLNNKQVFVEWPLGASLQEAEEATALAKSRGLKTIIGLQSRADSLVLKLKELVDTNAIGRVIGTSVVGSFGGMPPDAAFQSNAYYQDIKLGGNAYTIWFGHFLDSFIHVLGGFEDLTSILKVENPTAPMLAADGTTTQDQTITRTVPDHVLVQGTLKSGAPASIVYRPSQASINDVGLRWIICGTEGEIEVTMADAHWQMNSPGRTLRIRRGREAVEDVEFETNRAEDWTAKVPHIGGNTALILDAFAKGDRARFADFESSLETHRLLEQILLKAKFPH